MQYIPNLIGFLMLVMGSVMAYYVYRILKAQKEEEEALNAKLEAEEKAAEEKAAAEAESETAATSKRTKAKGKGKRSLTNKPKRRVTQPVNDKIQGVHVLLIISIIMIIVGTVQMLNIRSGKEEIKVEGIDKLTHESKLAEIKDLQHEKERLGKLVDNLNGQLENKQEFIDKLEKELIARKNDIKSLQSELEVAKSDAASQKKSAAIAIRKMEEYEKKLNELKRQ